MHIYLDWNSYGFLHPQVAERMNYVAQNYGNPASKHSLGQKTKRLMHDIRQSMLQALNATDYNIIFTASATEANRLVAELYKDRLFVSNIEHPSMREYGIVISVNQNAELTSMPQKDGFLLSYMLANHETGIINDIKNIGDQCRANGGLLHSDMVQAYGRIELSLADLSPDYATIASHKAGGPIGVAALLAKKGLPLPIVKAGTAPVSLIAGMYEALKIPRASNTTLENMLNPQWILGYHCPRLPNTTCILCHNKTKLMMMLDCMNILCSTGAACTNEVSDRAHSPFAMGIEHDTIRISSGWKTTQDNLLTVSNLLLANQNMLDFSQNIC